MAIPDGNPYAPPVEASEDVSRPRIEQPDYVAFGGNHCPQDCWLWFRWRDVVVHLYDFIARFWIAIAVIAWILLTILDHHAQGNRLWPIFFLLIAILAAVLRDGMESWVRLWFRSRRQVKRRHYIDRGRFEGFLDADGITVITDEVVNRVAWSAFFSPLMAVDRIELTFHDSGHRWILPSRFFASAREYRLARRMLCDKFFPKFDELVRAAFERLEYSGAAAFGADEVERMRCWTTQQWPFDRGKCEFECAYPVFNRNRLGYRFRVFIAWFKFWLWQVFPYLVVLPLWLWFDYHHFDGWSFLIDGWLGSLMFAVPWLMVLACHAWQLMRRYASVAGQWTEPMRVLASETGYCMAGHDRIYWGRWEEGQQMISSSDAVGWTMADTECRFERRYLAAGKADELERLLTRIATRAIQ